MIQILQAVNEIKEHIEIVHTAEFGSFLSNLFPSLREVVVSKTNPQFEDNDENKIRRTILDIFNRFPNTQILQQIVFELMTISLKVIQEDNEENALIALKSMFDLHKTYRPNLENQVQVRLFTQTAS